MPCELCVKNSENILFESEKFRIVLVEDANYLGFCRIIWNAHVKEMSDLSVQDQQLVFHALIKTELALKKILNPDKINLASLGNVVPHLHWHIIPRFKQDSHFPLPIWTEPVRLGQTRTDPNLTAKLRGILAESFKT